MLIIDAFAFCRNNEKQSGQLELSDLARLRAECVSGDGQIAWALEGSTENTRSPRTSGYPILHLTVSGTVQLMCQRCLTPYVFQIKSESMILLAKDEQSADEIDAALIELIDDEIEVIVGSKSFDIKALIEDEALLTIPLSPKHEVCPEKEMLDAFATAKKESPFAVLKGRAS